MTDEGLSVSFDASEANAAFIVHAVNLHDEMVEALTALNSALESNCDLPFSIKARKALGEDGVAAWLRVRSLLSKSNPTQKGE